MREYHISPFKVPAILAKGRLEFAKEVGKVGLVPGMQEVLEKLDKKEYVLGILTSNSAANIKDFLKKNDLHMFDFVEGDIGIFSKKRSLQRLMSKWGYKPQEVTYIGDEVRDIDAARTAAVSVIAVSWGFNTHDFLARRKPDHLVDTPSKLLKVIG
jgi:phosphoglycolate phosphatase-like HAD superfamily hydrolase